MKILLFPAKSLKTFLLKPFKYFSCPKPMTPIKKIKLIILLFALVGCKTNPDEEGKIRVVTTTNIIANLVSEIGGDKITLRSLMGPGVDPHLYKASEGDVMRLFKADIVFFNGLHLEGKLADIFEKMKTGKRMVPLGESIPKEQLIASESFGGNYDPHIWFNVSFFKILAKTVTAELSGLDPEHAAYYEDNNRRYQNELDILEKNLQSIISELPKEKRILVTAHDAFSYFGHAYDFKVVGLQGISTATEAGVRDVRKLTKFIIANDIKAIFIENSIPIRTIEALQAAVRARNHQVEIGGTLYSDSLGNTDSDEGTYIGMFTFNVQTIVNALK